CETQGRRRVVRAKRLLVSATLVGVVSLLLVLARTDKANADFKPALTLTVTNTQPETPSDFKIDFGIRDKKDVNFGGVVSFIPPDWGIVRGDKIPIGEQVGQLDALATLGLITAPATKCWPCTSTSSTPQPTSRRPFL